MKRKEVVAKVVQKLAETALPEKTKKDLAIFVKDLKKVDAGNLPALLDKFMVGQGLSDEQRGLIES